MAAGRIRTIEFVTQGPECIAHVRFLLRLDLKANGFLRHAAAAHRGVCDYQNDTAGAIPVLLLHAELLPLNALRLAENARAILARRCERDLRLEALLVRMHLCEVHAGQHLWRVHAGTPPVGRSRRHPAGCACSMPGGRTGCSTHPEIGLRLLNLTIARQPRHPDVAGGGAAGRVITPPAAAPRRTACRADTGHAAVSESKHGRRRRAP